MLRFIDELSGPRPSRSTRPARQPAILCVESNRGIAQPVNDLLDPCGWHVWRAENGTSAKIFLRSEQPYALLLVEQELRDMGGLDVVRYARSLSHRKSLPVLFFSLEDCAREAKAAGATEFLRKPHDLFKLADTIGRLLAVDCRKK